jgi:hypothetical protein
LPDTLRLRAGTRYRLRWMNIGFVAVQRVSFLRDSSALEQWSPLAKDGAPLPASRAKPRPARFVFGVGETYDFTYTPGDVGTRRITIATNRRDSLWLTLPVKVE